MLTRIFKYKGIGKGQIKGARILDTGNSIFYEDFSWFYGRWHGTLWKNQKTFYAADQVTKTDLDATRLSQSMTRANLLD